jgi:hypothetical protein
MNICSWNIRAKDYADMSIIIKETYGGKQNES